MSNKAAKALIFFVVALLAFMVSSVFAMETYNILADASMREEYSNPGNVTVDDVNDEDYNSNNNNRYYSNINTLNDSGGNLSSHSLFDMNIFDLFNSSDDSSSGSSDVSDMASNIFDEIMERIGNFFNNL